MLMAININEDSYEKLVFIQDIPLPGDFLKQLTGT
jgi:hypothetical protein